MRPNKVETAVYGNLIPARVMWLCACVRWWPHHGIGAMCDTFLCKPFFWFSFLLLRCPPPIFMASLVLSAWFRERSIQWNWPMIWGVVAVQQVHIQIIHLVWMRMCIPTIMKRQPTENRRNEGMVLEMCRVKATPARTAVKVKLTCNTNGTTTASWFICLPVSSWRWIQSKLHIGFACTWPYKERIELV